MPTVIPCYFFPIKDQQDDKMTLKNSHKQTKKNCRLGSFWLITAVTDLYLSWCRWIRPMGTKERTCPTYWCRFLTNNHPENQQIYPLSTYRKGFLPQVAAKTTELTILDNTLGLWSTHPSFFCSWNGRKLHCILVAWHFNVTIGHN